jgi:4-diphosphocytidyl-2-C-methyl-D-erythritol kinase
MAVRVTAYAKVNLSLEVLGKRSDGFHEIRSVMQSISLADELVIEECGRLTLECDVAELSGDDNLVTRAARLLSKNVGREAAARLRLSKGIPVASGLGGASADAAAALVGLARLWDIEISHGQMSALAASLGSDVPFFLNGGTALIRGRGEVVESLPDAPSFWLVLVVPEHSLAGKTAALYSRLTSKNWSTGQRTEEMARAISRGLALPLQMAGNVFEDVAEEIFPGLRLIHESMSDAGCAAVHLSGAGPALFSLFESESAAATVAHRLESIGLLPRVARTLTSHESHLQPIWP